MRSTPPYKCNLLLADLILAPKHPAGYNKRTHMDKEKSVWLRVAELLKKIGSQEAAKAAATGGAPVDSPRREGLNKVAREAKKEATEFTKKVTSKNPEVRKTEQERVKDKTYEETEIDVARKQLEDAQAGSVANTPVGFEGDPIKIQSPAVAEFTAAMTSIAHLPTEYQDPNIVYTEVAKLYRSIRWKSASTKEIIEARKAIDAGIQYAKELADHKYTEGFSQVFISEGEGADYVFNEGINNQESFDLYRSRRTPDEDFVEVAGGRTQVEADALNAERVVVDRLLKNAQTKLDTVGKSLTDEIKVLSRVQEKLDEGFENGSFSEEISGMYRDLTVRRLKEVHEAKARMEKGTTRGRRETSGFSQNAEKLTDTQQKILKEGMPPEYQNLIKEILELYDRPDVTQRELEELRSKLNKALTETSGLEAIERYLKAKVPNSGNPDIDFEKRTALVREIKKHHDALETIVFDRLKEFVPDAYERSYYHAHPKDKIWVEGNWDNHVPTDFHNLEDPTMRRLFKIAHGILDLGTQDKRGDFRSNFGLYETENWKSFLQSIDTRLTAEGWDAFQKEEFISLFNGLRDMRELVHNLEFAGSFANLEILNKMVSNTLAGDLDAWIYYTPGMRFALSVYLENIRHITAQNKGWLFAELMDPSSIHETFIDTLCREHMFSAVESGSIKELEYLHELYIDTDTRQDAIDYMRRAIKVAKSFGTITLRAPTMMAEAKIARNFISGPQNNLIQDMDVVRLLIFKYGLGRPGAARLYVALTGDEKGGADIPHMSAAQLEKFFFEAEHHPEFGKNIAQFRNFFKMADRFGDGKSFWGIIEGGKHWSAEMRRVRGVGIKLFDAIARVTNDVRTKEIDGHFGAGASKTVNFEHEEWWAQRMHNTHVEEFLKDALKKEIDIGMNEFLYKLPGEVIDKLSMELGYEHLRFDAIERVLERTNPNLLNQILKNADGSDFVVNVGNEGKVIEHLKDLWQVDTSKNPTDMHVGILAADKQALDARMKLFEQISYRLAGDLTLVQQHAVESFWLGAEGKAGGRNFREQDMKKGLLDRDIIAVFHADDPRVLAELRQRAQMVKEYIDAIQELTTTERVHGKTYIERLTEKYIDGREHNIATTTDIPINRIRYEHWGSSVVSRTTGDAQNVSLGMKGYSKFIQSFEGHMEEEGIYKIIKEDIQTPLTNADPELSRNIGGFCMDNTFWTYRESDLATNLGIFGRGMTSQLTLEVAESISKFLGFGGKIPRWMIGARSQQLIGHGAMRLTASDMWVWTDHADEKNILPKKHHPLGWAKNAYYNDYTKEGLRKRYHGNWQNIAPQYFMTGMPISVGIVLWQAFSEKDEHSN